MLVLDAGSFMGLAFEDCCREWVGRHAPADRFPALGTVGSWWSRDGSLEIDVVGVTKRRHALLGSCKWSTRARASALEDLLAARDRLGPSAKDAALAIFARGFDSALVRRAEPAGVALISAADLFSP